MKRKKKILVFSILFIIIFSACMLAINDNEKNINKNTILTSNMGLSNKKIGWGIKREDNHNQPDLGAKNKQLIDTYKAIAMGDKDKKIVYLTFDEGYESGYTSKILEVLKQNDIKATFFITAHYVNTQEVLIKQMLDNGHIIGNHTVNHKSMPDLTNEKVESEIMDLHTSIYQKFGYEMKYMRPPKGEISQRTLDITNSLGYTTVMWSLAYDDWNEKEQKGEEYAKSKIINNIHPGAVILLHGNSKDNTNVLDYCIKEIKKMGYEFKSLDNFEK